jgi:hypothetical protein
MFGKYKDLVEKASEIELKSYENIFLKGLSCLENTRTLLKRLQK